MRAGTIAALVRKDLKLFVADRRALVMSFVAPIAIGSFFGFIFSGSGNEPAARVPVAAVDQDGTAISRAVVAGLSADTTVAVQALPLDEARAAVRAGRIAVAVVLPVGFGDAAGQAMFGGARKPVVDFLYDPSKSSERAMVKGITTQHVMEAVSREVFSGEQGRTLTRQTIETLDKDAGLPADERVALTRLLESSLAWSERTAASPAPGALPSAGGFSMPYDTRDEAVTARADTPYNSYAHAFAGMGVQFLLFACLDLAIAMLTERQQGLWKRLRAAPLSRLEVLAARGLSATLISLLVLVVTFAFGMAVFGIRVDGSVVGFLLVCLATALMAATFGLLVATLGKTPGGTRGVAILAVLLMVMLGGAWVPSFVFPAWMQSLTMVIPARWAVDGLDSTTWRGASLVETLPAVGALLAFAAAFAAVAVARFRWTED